LATLRARIRRDGPLRIDEYMAACLGDPRHGYWRKADTIGANGDFITAPEISQVFGELIGLWCAVTWQALGQPAPLHLVELGPGRGTLMQDLLRAAQAAPLFLGATNVYLIEISEPLRTAQRNTLAAYGVASDPRATGSAAAPARSTAWPPISWHDSLDRVPEGSAIVIGNEFIDALPIRQLIFLEGAWRERVVALDSAGALRFGAGQRVPYDGEPEPQPGAIVEVRASEDALLAQLARRVAPVVALFIDYGPAEAGSGGATLQAVRRHAYADPLVEPGSADLTAHVRFAALARKARAAGLAVDGPMTQAEFLGRLGIAERTDRLMRANPEHAGAVEAAVQRLISPTGMGSLFKALAVRTAGLPPPFPFG
jgi:SAM-dependent MidA family methyltransferase